MTRRSSRESGTYLPLIGGLNRSLRVRNSLFEWDGFWKGTILSVFQTRISAVFGFERGPLYQFFQTQISACLFEARGGFVWRKTICGFHTAKRLKFLSGVIYERGPFISFSNANFSRVWEKCSHAVVSLERSSSTMFYSLIVRFFSKGGAPPAREIQSSYRLYGGVAKYWVHILGRWVVFRMLFSAILIIIEA